MAGIIKKQILKHLSRFTKNLSPEQINLSTLRGEGQLTEFELDEEAIQNMLDLPTWLAITRVYCNRAAIRIQWTKLKTHPICLTLDKVEVEMKTCEEPRPPNGPSPIALAAGQSEYGFAEKVVEGMFIDVGCVSIKIKSRTFRASLQLWQFQGYSVSPNWQQSDLRFTRLTHPQWGQVLTFKQITWQTLRIEADASESCEDAPSTPLRLLTNSGRINIALKRRIKDCLVLSSELSFFLDDLLWVLTDSQLRALLSYAKSLTEAIQKSVRQKKKTGGQVPSSPTIPNIWSHSTPPPSTSSGLCQYFERFDVKETSYHLLISRLDLHVCDESQAQGTVSGGAIQMTLHRITLDYYPSHRAGQSCAHWLHTSSAMGTCEQWLKDLAEERKEGEEPELSKMGKASDLKQRQNGKNPSSPSLYFRSVLIRVDNLDIHQVSSSGHTPQKPPLVSCARIPSSCSAVHLQYTEYYCLPGESLPVPSPALYIQIHGLLLSLAAPTILWLNLFMLDLSHHLQQFAAVSSTVGEGITENRNIRLDGFNLKLSLPVEPPTCSPPERPSSVCAQISRVTLTNTRQAPGSSLDLLQRTFRLFAAQPLLHWPPGPLHPVFVSHAYPSSSPPCTSLWSLHSSGLSVSFGGLGLKHQKLLHPISFTAWACLLHPEHHLQVLLNIEDLIRVQLNHYQYLTLLRGQEQLQSLLENLQKFELLSSEIALTTPSAFPTLVCVGLLISTVNLSLIFPVTACLETPPQLGDSEKSSLIGLDLAEGPENGGEMSRASPTKDGKVPITVHAKEAQQKSLDGTLHQNQPAQEVPQKMLHLMELAKDALGKTEVVRDTVQRTELAVDGLQGKEFTYDTLLSTLGLTQERLSLGKERMQRFLRDTRQKDNDASHCRSNAAISRTQSQQSLETASLEGLDVLSLDSETSDGFTILLESENGLHPGEADRSGESADDISQSTEGPEPQQILLLTLRSVSCVSHLQGKDISISVEALDASCGPTTESDEGLVTTTPPSSPSPCVTMKFDLGPAAAHLSPLALHNGFLQVNIQRFCSELPVSSLTHIGPFLEDEQISEILPMIIQITNSSITLKDDGPRIYFSPLLPPPVTLTIQKIQVQRKEDGTFYITGDDLSQHKEESCMKCQSKEELQKELLMMQTKLDQQKERESRLLQEVRKYNPSFHL
ncbi:bridge-like lipid transfer protein family member 3A [Pelobates fuscus]|uniref:bridge-like lipid transfer protein family member 3A n=1 Tax=Pelobates fuscus TaxID=191477 RepID=UPI002FE4BCE4